MLIEKKKCIVTALKLKHKVFVIYIAALTINSGDEVHPLRKAQIAHLKAYEAFVKVSNKYANFANIFSPELAATLSKHMEINNHGIELVDN